MTESMRIVFMGTPEAAVPSLKALIEAGKEGSIRVAGVVSQPDRPAGRGQEMSSPPVALVARESSLPLFQPVTVKEEGFLQRLKELSPDVIVVVAYGQILPRSILELPPQGCVNLHFSLLPAYRGPAPVHWALINGDEVTGVTTIRIIDKVDAGPILLQHKIPIMPEDNVEILETRLANAGAELLIETLAQIRSESIEPTPQRESLATKAPSLKTEDGRIDWRRGANALWNQIRGTTPRPGAFTTLDAKRLKIHRASLSDRPGTGAPGTVKSAGVAGLEIVCGKGGLLLKEIQIEGGKRLPAAEFLRGHPVAPGVRLGEV